MINVLEYTKWDDSQLHKCCPDPKPNPPDPPSSDCCFNSWQGDLTSINLELTEVNKELAHVQKHLAIATIRYTRLKTWNDELTTANDLAINMCHKLEIIEAQLINICVKTDSTIKGVEILYCMVRDFYQTLDILQEKYDYLQNCIKCLGNSALTPTQGIGKCLADYGALLTAVLATRDGLIQLMMMAMDSSISLHRQLCDPYGYKKLIRVWQDTLACGIPCEEGTLYSPGASRQPSPPPADKNQPEPDPFCLEPILRFPICNERYYRDIHEWYEIEKKVVKDLNHEVKELTKRQVNLQASQQSLQNALKEVTPSLRCS